MITEEFKHFIQSTYRQDIFHYKLKTLGKICEFDDWTPNLIKVFKQILRRIKAGEGTPDNNPRKKKGMRKSLPAINNKYMTIFFEPPEPPGIEYYYIYGFTISEYKI
jgi:hypothetical protein